MKFSRYPKFTEGATDIVGCLGIINAQSADFTSLGEEWKEYDYSLTDKTKEIIAHYLTEPPQINFVSVTTFFYPGTVLGLDILEPKLDFVELREISDEVSNLHHRDIRVYDLNPAVEVSKEFLDRDWFPFHPGCRVFEANAEFSTFKLEEKVKVDYIYAIAAIGIPTTGSGKCRLIMEDAGYIPKGIFNTKNSVKTSIAKSILACEKVEEPTRVGITYEKIYIASTFHEIKKNAKQVIPAWAQVQFMYALPPKEMVPKGKSLKELSQLAFEEWKSLLIIDRAREILGRLSKKHRTFINVCVDDWRGWRFIFDTDEVRNCDNNCDNCNLFHLLKNKEERKDFSAGLYRASREDKELFGKQNFLNCKSLEQYRDCYVNYLAKRANTEQEIREELSLIKNFRIIFSKETVDLPQLEEKIRKSILESVLKQVDENKGKKIIRIWNEMRVTYV